jgi:(2Fe-2S) ferredoxin
MTERLKAWQCVGCGRLESSAPCLGICQDRPVMLVSPRGDTWETTYKAMQERARRLLDPGQDGPAASGQAG